MCTYKSFVAIIIKQPQIGLQLFWSPHSYTYIYNNINSDKNYRIHTKIYDSLFNKPIILHYLV